MSLTKTFPVVEMGEGPTAPEIVPHDWEFLLAGGREVKLTRLAQHQRSLKKAKELGLLSIVEISDEEQSVLELLDTLYASKQLQYIVTGAKTFPVFGPLAAVAMRLIYAISPTVGYEPLNLPYVA